MSAKIINYSETDLEQRRPTESKQKINIMWITGYIPSLAISIATYAIMNEY